MILKNAKHEIFAQEIARGATNREAAVACGYKETSAASAGSRLIGDNAVKLRVNELLRRKSAQTVALVSVDKSWVIERLITLSDKCVSDKQWSPAAAAKSLELIGKDLGMFRDFVRVEVVNSMFAKMGEVVANLVQDQDLLEKIMMRWQRLAEDSAIEVAVRTITEPDQHDDSLTDTSSVDTSTTEQ